MTPEQKLAAGRLKAISAMPYYRAAIMGMIPRPTPGLGTLGVTKTAILLYDPAAFEKWTVDEVGAALLHEVGHLVRGHHKRAQCCGAENNELSAIWNAAADCEINDDLQLAGIQLPEAESRCYPSTYGFEDGKSAETYFSLLRQGQQKKKKGKAGGVASDTPSVGKGFCGSAAGRKFDQEPDAKKEPGRAEIDVARIQKEVARAVQAQAQKQKGSVPANLLRWAEETVTPPKVSWREKVSRSARNGLATQAGVTDYSYARPSRRQMGVGFGDGKPIFPTMRGPKPRTVIATDTSGSMGQDDLTVALRESNGVIRAVGSDVIFMASDAAVHTNQTVRSWRDILPLLKGGGGTSFCPVFEEIAGMAERPTLCIYITDGCGDAPAEPPKGCAVIWLLVGKYKQRPHFAGGKEWGEFIELDD